LLELGREAGDVKQQISVELRIAAELADTIEKFASSVSAGSTDDAASFHCGGNLETPAEHYPDELS
jgi:hypothetical protein